MIKTQLRASQGRWLPVGVWVEFPRKGNKSCFLPVRAVVMNDPMKMVTVEPPPDSGAYPIKRTYWDAISFQNIFPLRESTSPLNESSCSPTGS